MEKLTITSYHLYGFFMVMKDNGFIISNNNKYFPGPVLNDLEKNTNYLIECFINCRKKILSEEERSLVLASISKGCIYTFDNAYINIKKIVEYIQEIELLINSDLIQDADISKIFDYLIKIKEIFRQIRISKSPVDIWIQLYNLYAQTNDISEYVYEIGDIIIKNRNYIYTFMELYSDWFMKYIY